MLLYIIVGLTMGIIFGIALEKGRVFEPGIIIGQFQLRNWLLIKMFMSAIATTMVVVAVLYGSGMVSLHVKPAIFPATILGGLLFGVGMALTGACPGTVLAQLGAGYKDSWAILAGGILGAMTYGYLEPILAPLSSGPGEITLADITGAPFWLLALIVAILITAMLFFLEKWRPWQEDLGLDHDGVPSGSSAAGKKGGSA